MILLKLKGGMGNQMFEYAFARCLQHGTEEQMIIDTALMKNTKLAHEVYTLDKFFLSDQAVLLEADSYNSTGLIGIVYQLARYSFAGVGMLFGKATQYRLESVIQLAINRIGLHLCADGYISQTRSTAPVKIVEGYWQSHKYFLEIEADIRRELKVKVPPLDRNLELLQEMENSASVCVHIRRGDYVNSPEHMVCTKKYYIDAMAEVAKRIQNPVFYIFSDDIAWVKENLPFKYPVRYIETGNSNYEELRLMYSCRHFVISNSSFSWWAQYLCDNPDKVVIAPNKWFTDGRKTDLFMPGWVLVEP